MQVILHMNAVNHANIIIIKHLRFVQTKISSDV